MQTPGYPAVASIPLALGSACPRAVAAQAPLQDHWPVPKSHPLIPANYSRDPTLSNGFRSLLKSHHQGKYLKGMKLTLLFFF